jgi:hypothetical protein
MKKRNLLLAGASLLALLTILPSIASAGGYHGYHRHGGVRWGIGIGVPLAIGAATYYGPRYVYPGPYYPAGVYYPPVAPVVVAPAPVTYVEQPPQVAAAPAAGIWYYCGSSQTYYPYVKQCAEGWQQVPASPAR